jgi:tryptophan-rich sensory protein
LLKFIKKYLPEIIGILITLMFGLLSGYVGQAGDSSWFMALNKPSFNPPSWLFGLVWPVLYIMIGIAFGKVWRGRNENPGLLDLWLLQFILNISWSPLFFRLHRIDLALLDIILLWVVLLLFVKKANKVNPAVAKLFIPYLIWVTFAAILNLAFYLLN